MANQSLLITQEPTVIPNLEDGKTYFIQNISRHPLFLDEQASAGAASVNSAIQVAGATYNRISSINISKTAGENWYVWNANPTNANLVFARAVLAETG